MAKEEKRKLTDADHVQAVKDLLGGHAKSIPEYDRHANQHLYSDIATPEREPTVKDLIDDGTLETAFHNLLQAYIKVADLGENAKKFLTDISISRQELQLLFAGRLGSVYGPEDATILKNRLMDKLRDKVREGVDFSLANITGTDSLHQAIDYVITEGKVEEQFPTWKDEVAHYGDIARQITGSAINSALVRYETKAKQEKAYEGKERKAA